MRYRSMRRWYAAAVASIVVIAGIGAVAQDPTKDAPAPPSKADFTKVTAAPTTPARRPPPAAGRLGRHDILDLEAAVGQAELILAVRLVDVTETRVVHGGRTEQVTQQYKFEPVRVLKGIFARDSLLMTGQDLGIYRFADAADRLERGQLMLVMLGRQGAGYFNCCPGETLGQSIPRLAGGDDPLLRAVDVLIAAARSRDRLERAGLLRDGLASARGRDAAPLLLALGRRPVLASRSPGSIEAILPLLKSESPALREVAARTLGALLDTAAGPHAPRNAAVVALAEALAGPGPNVAARVAAIDALGSGGAEVVQVKAAMEWLTADRPAPTIAESAARLRAVARVAAAEARGFQTNFMILPVGKLTTAAQKARAARDYAALPLDAPADLQAATGEALAQLDPSGASGQVAARVASKVDAGLGIVPEIALLGTLPAGSAAPALLDAWSRPLDLAERLAFAQACERVADARLVPALASLLDPGQYQVRYHAEEALRRIGTAEAASALWPHLDEQAQMPRKLQLIAFLGRHGFRDGYAQAIEHLSQPVLRDEAVEALAAIGEPRAVPELRRIWATSNDLGWNAAAIRALARLGQADIAPRLLEIARTPGDPLAASALIGLGDLGSPEAVPIVRAALDSRSDDLVIAASRASSSLLARPGIDAPAVRDRLAVILADADASAAVRLAALDALAALGDPRLPKALAAVARDSNLEGSPLLARVEAALAAAK